MSFSFSFDIDAAEVDDELDLPTTLDQLTLQDDAAPPTASTRAIPHREVPLEELVSTLPPLLSYTPVTVPLSAKGTQTARHTTLFRRDLFDARFQVLNQDEHDEGDEAPSKGKEREEVFVDESSDLVKGVYEGGLKTWECSLDLVDCLDQRGYSVDQDLNTPRLRGKGILEVGCGTAVPTCALFARLLNEIAKNPTEPGSPRPSKTRIHVQDYNKQVLSLITLPNILLTFAQHLSAPTIAPDADEEPPAEPEAGGLEVTPEFLDLLDSFLEQENIDLRFFEGDWAGMDEAIKKQEEGGYDLVLTSETVYSLSSLEPLLDLLGAATRRPAPEDGLESLCLVACKRIYFGVGGGELEFRRRVEERGGQVETVWGEGEGKGKTSGVGRTVMSVKWRQ
ncbi:hypothetical protein JCM10296v2_001904 [Rhodotorula toruloides]